MKNIHATNNKTMTPEIKTKKYYSLWIVDNKDNVSNQQLMLSELHILSKILKENKRVEIMIVECSKDMYNLIFNY